MHKHILRFFVFGAVIILVNGCSSSGIFVRSYVEDRPRVDQDIAGNTGFYSGTPREKVETPERVKTRKMIVVEVSKDASAVKEKSSIKPTPDKKSDQAVSEGTSSEEVVNEVSVPEKSATEEKPKSVVEYVEYTVEKDDTLQKVAKKFYGSYGKWIKIYEYNKQNIKDPDHIRPGSILKIPQN